MHNMHAHTKAQAEQSQSVLKVGSMEGYDVMTIGDPLDQDIKLVSKVIGIFSVCKRQVDEDPKKI